MESIDVSFSRYLQEIAGNEADSYATNDHRNRTINKRRFVVLGGGTAGYLSALAIKKHIKHAEVSIIDSSKLGPIGVGEATVDAIVPFLHRFLGLNIHHFYEVVRPTWKFGIRFEWGSRGKSHFNAPFEWSNNTIGIRGSLEYTGNINFWNEQSRMMDKKVVPFFVKSDGSVRSHLHHYKFAYHLDNGTFISYLKAQARLSKVRIVDRIVKEVELNLSNSENIESIRYDDGSIEYYDYYVDCSGFKSLLLEKKYGSKFVSFDQSLFTDRALTFNMRNNGKIKPYTTATTMKNGWCWTIPLRQEDHCGYVYSSSFCDGAAAKSEIEKLYPGEREYSQISFKSGRHESFWIGNMIAIGNSFAFVEPLESTGILMICNQIRTLVHYFSLVEEEPTLVGMVNKKVCSQWDRLKWFLAVHYKYNNRYASPFWKYAREKTDTSGLDEVLAVFRNGAPLTLRREELLNTVKKSAIAPFYGLAGLDCILLGQKVKSKLLPMMESKEQWFRRKEAVENLLANALPQEQALKLIDKNADYLTQFLECQSSWFNEVGKH